MTIIKETELSKMKANYGFATDEIKLKQSIKALTDHLENTDDKSTIKFLEKEIEIKQQQLKSLRELRE